MSRLVLVTGASGKTGRNLVAQLEEAGVPYRAASRGAAPAFDWSRPETWDTALDDVATVYLVTPPGVADAPARMLVFLEAAVAKGARRFVLLSMASMPAGPVQQWLEANTSDWSVLGPAVFMENFSEGPFAASIREESTIYSNTGPGRAPFIAAADIARAAFAALTAPAALNATFTLTGDETLSFDRVAELIGEACGRPITHTQISTEAMAGRFRDRGLPEMTAMFLAASYQTIADGWQDRTDDGFKTLTGQAATTFEAFAKAHADAWLKSPR